MVQAVSEKWATHQTENRMENDQKCQMEAPSMPEGEMPSMPDAEAPDGQNAPDKEAPSKPEGEAPYGQNGERPDMPEDSSEQASSVFTISGISNAFSRISELTIESSEEESSTNV